MRLRAVIGAALLVMPLLVSARVQQPAAKDDRSPHTWEMRWPSRPTTFAAVGEGGIERSLDGGKTWLPANQGLPASIGAAAVTPVLAIAAAKVPGPIFALTEVEGVFRSDD